MVRRNDEQMLPRPGFHYHLQESAYTGPQKRDNHRLLQHFGPWPGTSGADTMQRDGRRLLLRLAQRGAHWSRGLRVTELEGNGMRRPWVLGARRQGARPSPAERWPQRAWRATGARRLLSRRHAS